MPKMPAIDRRPARWIRIGEALRLMIEAHGISQEEAAYLAGVSRGTIIDWIGSTRSKAKGRIPDERMFAEAIVKLCEAIGTDPRMFDLGSTATREPGSPYQAGFAQTMAVRQYRGVLAAGSPDEESYFEEVEPYEIPTSFIVSMKNVDRHNVFQINGSSLEDRAYSGDRIVAYDDGIHYDNSLVLATDPDAEKIYAKGLVSVRGRFQLHSIKAGHAAFLNLDGWRVHGHAIAIIGNPDVGQRRNIEWLYGRPLPAFEPEELRRIKSAS